MARIFLRPWVPVREVSESRNPKSHIYRIAFHTVSGVSSDSQSRSSTTKCVRRRPPPFSHQPGQLDAKEPVSVDHWVARGPAVADLRLLPLPYLMSCREPRLVKERKPSKIPERSGRAQCKVAIAIPAGDSMILFAFVLNSVIRPTGAGNSQLSTSGQWQMG